MASLTDWLARTFYITPDQTATSQQVADAQAKIVADQKARGVITKSQANELNYQINNSTLSQTADQILGSGGASGLVLDVASGGKDSGVNDGVSYTLNPDGTVSSSGTNTNTGFNLFGSLRWLIIAGAIAGGIYLFVKLDGFAWLKKKLA